MEWKHYLDLEPIRRLHFEGRELVGKTVCLTEKRDGENVSTWLDETNILHVSSHNQEVASTDIYSRLKGTPEYDKVIDLLTTEKTEYGHNYIIYGELLKKVSPTRIEPRRKWTHYIVFDIWDCDEQRFLSYTQMYQLCYHYKIPIVKVVDFFIPESLQNLQDHVLAALKWCKRHRREGVVGKCYDTQVYFKEKVDIPTLPKIPKQPRIELPVMPDDRILRALQHAYDEVGADKWSDKSVAMPIVAKHIGLEASEHNYSTPRNYYFFYINTPLEKITGEKIQ